jgi:hypothetical protein
MAIFTKKDCLHEIESSRKFYLMDYASNLDECLPKSSVKIITGEQIEYMVNRHRKFIDIYEKYWNWSEKFLDRLESCDNAKYISKQYNFSEKQLWQNKIITIELERFESGSE